MRRAWAWPLVPVYAAVVGVKAWLFARGWLRSRRLDWPVVSVGSLSAGGAGKTPVVLALAELLNAGGWQVDILSRGYRRAGGGVERVDAAVADAARRFGDEPVLLARRSGVPVWVAADRFAAGAAAEASGRAGRGVHLLDDGFQHRQLARTVDLVLVTAQDLEEALLPAGDRREPLAALGRADAVIVREEESAAVMPRLAASVRPGTPIWRMRRELSFPEVLPVLWAQRPTYGHLVFCGIARPEDFVAMLRGAGVRTLEVEAFADHHAYTEGDIRDLIATADAAIANGFVTTEKDAVKLSPAMRTQLEAVGPLVVARLDAVFVDEAAVVDFLQARLQ